MRKFTIKAGDATATFALVEDAPSTSEALWESLPISGEITHGRWAGSAVWVKTDRDPIAKVSEVELPVTSIYPGTMVMRPNPRGVAELFISYGVAESRGPKGRTYATPVAEIIDGEQEFYEELARTWSEGSTPIVMSKVTEA